MEKITTLFKKDPSDLGRVINEVDPKNEWALTNGRPTRKFDGTACAIINGELYKRYDCKLNKETGEYKRPVPEGAISCQEADMITGHHPHWIKCDREDNANKYHLLAFDAAFDSGDHLSDGTYELCGPKVQGNPENLKFHTLIPHGQEIVWLNTVTFDSIKKTLTEVDVEGIVFHGEEGKMCKIRKSDFGIKR